MDSFVRLSHLSAISSKATSAEAMIGENGLGSWLASKLFMGEGQEGMQMPTMTVGTHLPDFIISIFQLCVLPLLFDGKLPGAGMVLPLAVYITASLGS